MTDIIDKIMEQAQVFASAWSIAGTRFDIGDGVEQAEQEKDALRQMIDDEIARLREQVAALTAERDAERERCAKVCDDLQAEMLDQGVAGPYGDAFARRIRGQS